MSDIYTKPVDKYNIKMTDRYTKAPAPIDNTPAVITAQQQSSVSNYQQALRNMTSNGAQQTADVVTAAKIKRQAEEAAAAKAAAQAAAPGFNQSVSGNTGEQFNFNGPITDTRRKVLETAASRLGTPYAWGGGGAGVYASRGTGKGTQNVIGVDCSGLTSWVYSKFGINMPHNANQQLRTMGVKTSVANARPGDLIGFNRGGHVTIYAGNGMMIESPSPGGHVQMRRVPSGTFAVHLTLPGD